LIGDIAKGIVPVVITKALAFDPLYAAISGISAILGHNFSIFLKFKGGKGVATSIGAVLAFSPHVGLFTVIMWLMTAKWTRYSSLSALVAFGLLPLSFYLIDYSRQNIIFGAIIAFLIFIRHTANIKRLVQGAETKIGQKA
jgi:glycerol-3-phosphate acyltransferase PlsY